jgi:hypothetical protein
MMWVTDVCEAVFILEENPQFSLKNISAFGVSQGVWSTFLELGSGASA